MSSDDFAIRIQGVSKYFQIYDAPGDRLKQFVAPRLQRMVGSSPKQYFKEFKALDNISFDVKKGETVGIIGRNGSGKSTLLQIICGTLAPSGGAVETRGRVAALLELGSGFNPEFTGRENVYMNAAVLGLMNEEIDGKFADIVAFADIGDFIEQPVKTYSSGMVVRLAFAVAINVEPEILIIDEALSVGDELFQRKCFSRIEAIKQNGATILFVSHSGSAIVELCDRAVLLDAGEHLAMGMPKHIVGKYQKLIYAPQDRRNAIREMMRLSEAGSSQTSEGFTTQQLKSQWPENKHAVEYDPEEFFDPNLIPQSSLKYESNGACIETPQIRSLSGKKVNCLKRREIYRYMYTVRFEQGATNVRFAMVIKTSTGLELGGAMSAPTIGQGIPYVAPGTLASIEFRFTCNLNPGSYFLNAGVRGIHQEEETYLHRVLDICVFKVMPVTDNSATALIDFNCVAEIELLENSIQRVVEE